MQIEEKKSMNKRKKIHKYTHEDGVALIFALAMLALLLIMLIGFMASSILEQRIAYSYSDSTGSRLLAQGSLLRIKDQLELTSEDLTWMRNRPDDDKRFAPLVSIADTATTLSQKTSDAIEQDGKFVKDESGEAYRALKPLLRRYIGPHTTTVPATDDIKKDWQWKNFFPQGANVDYPQWIYYYNNPDEDQITGRIAYVVIPNLGIDPTLFGQGNGDGSNTADKPFQIGESYDELGMGVFATAAGMTTIHKYTNWLSKDLLLSKLGIGSNSSALLTDEVKANLSGSLPSAVDSASDSGNAAGAVKEMATILFSNNQKIAEEKDWKENNRTFFDFKEVKDHSAIKNILDAVELDPSDVREQVAANIRDYMDKDGEPTGLVNPQDPSSAAYKNYWETATAPEYTGNELTPYINELTAAVTLTAKQTTVSEMNGDGITYKVNQTVEFSAKPEAWMELINMYAKDMNIEEGVIKDAEFVFSIQLESDAATSSVTVDPVATPDPVTGTTPDPAGSLKCTFRHDGTLAVPKQSYAGTETMTVENPEQKFPTFTVTTAQHNDAAGPKLTAKITLQCIKFDRALLKMQGIRQADASLATPPLHTLTVDFVKGWETNRVEPVAPGEGEPVPADTYQTSKELAEGDTLLYAQMNCQVEDPRCNLQKDDNWSSTIAWLTAAPTKPDYEKNSDADPKNDDLSKEMDYEVTDDPATVAAAYIRNDVMQSPWELGYIHRGTKWQTINLKSSLDPLKSEGGKVTYLNDGLLWDKLKFTDDAKTDKFNLNYPASLDSVFQTLLVNLRYHERSKLPDKTGNDIEEKTADTVKLSDADIESLSKWIANKCYEASGSDSAADGSKKYQRYIHRGQLANVIRDWAMKGASSDIKNNFADVTAEELAGKIIPMTRADADRYFEHFTVFAVAQTVKDVKGKIYPVKADGSLDTAVDCEHGDKAECKVDGDKIIEYDKITGTTYLVARLRREIDTCENTDDCLKGIHESTCKFKVKVLESYTLSDL